MPIYVELADTPTHTPLAAITDCAGLLRYVLATLSPFFITKLLLLEVAIYFNIPSNFSISSCCSLMVSIIRGINFSY